MKKNTKHFELRIDVVSMVIGDARAISYAAALRREVFESAEEMSSYFGARKGSDLERIIAGLK